MEQATSYDICIVGAGVAGSALAAYLGRNGFRVAIIEKKWEEPDDIVGELLQPSGVQKLTEMGLGDTLSGIDAQPINGYAMYLGDQPHRLDYPKDLTENTYNGYGFRYGRFVGSLRKASDGLPGVTQLEGSASTLIESPDGQVTGVEYQTRAGTSEEVSAMLTVVSQGPMASLRSPLNKARSEVKGFMLGVVLKDCELPFANHGHVIMADPAPILAYPVAENKIRILIDFPSELPTMKGEQLTNYLLSVIKPQLPSCLQNSFELAVETEKLKGRPTHLLASRPTVKEGAVLLGDALNMRHPTTGSGMTVALTDVKDLGDRLIALTDRNSLAIKAEVTRFYRRRHKENATVNILAYALYRVFRHETLRQACFKYLKRGGKFAAEPMSILSGISRSRSTLLKHFFAVAWLAVLEQQKPFPTPKKLKTSFRTVKDTLDIIVPLVRDEVPRVEA